MDPTLTGHLWQTRNAALAYLEITHNNAIFGFDAILFLLVAAVSLFGVGVAVRAFYAVTAKMMLLIVGVIVAIVGSSLLRFIYFNMQPIKNSLAHVLY